MPLTFPLTSVEGVPVTVLGAARSGLAVSRLLKEKGATVFVSEKGAASALAPSLEILEDAGIAYETGGHSERAYACDVMVISPGVRSDAPPVQEAVKRNIDVVSEIECASWFCSSPIVAITGSNGKTTTTTLLGRMLGDARKKHTVAGNIGTAFSGVVGALEPTDIAVLEVSSFQLDHIHAFRPDVSVLLNITPDHLDRYDGSMTRYAGSKGRITMNQRPSDLLITNADDAEASAIGGHTAARVLPFSIAKQLTQGAWLKNGSIVLGAEEGAIPVVRVDEMTLQGMHNVANAMAATLAAHTLGASIASIRATLRNFKGVEHRLEFVRSLHGVRYFNDSKATNVDSVLVALKAFDTPVILLLGGRDKGNDYTMMTDLVRQHVKHIVAIGESASKVIAAFGAVVSTETAGSMQEAVRAASAKAVSGDVVLLSPACASFDWFEHYEHRGKVFKEEVLAL